MGRVSSPGVKRSPGSKEKESFHGRLPGGKVGGQRQGQPHDGVAGRGDRERRRARRRAPGPTVTVPEEAAMPASETGDLAGVPLAAEGEGELRGPSEPDGSHGRGSRPRCGWCRAGSRSGGATSSALTSPVSSPKTASSAAGEVEDRGAGAEPQQLDLPALLLDRLRVREELVVERAVRGVVLAGRRRLLDAVRDEQHVLQPPIGLALLHLRAEGVERIADVGEPPVADQAVHHPLDGGAIGLGLRRAARPPPRSFRRRRSPPGSRRG